MSAPQFYNIGKGKRIEVKVCNEDSIQQEEYAVFYIIPTPARKNV